MAASAPETSAPAAGPERAAEEPKPLTARRCSSCGRVTFPPRERCPGCWGESGEPFELGPTGTVHSFTTIHVAPPGRTTPYTIAYVDLGPVRVLAEVTGEPRIDAEGRVSRRATAGDAGTAGYLIDLGKGREDD